MKKFSVFSLTALVLAFVLASADIAKAQGGDLRRRTVAITYFRDPVKVYFSGTTLRPNAKGEATVERWRKRNTSEIDITIENMIPAFNFGADYNTYVLWAITPAGQVDNLGEFRLSGSSARLKASTANQTFAMIITAEPHYLVRLPSRMVILENLTPVSSKVQVQATEVFFTGDSGRFYTDSSVPELAERNYNKTPMELLQARRAIQIAKLADGEKYDPNDYQTAARSLEQAEEAYRQGASVHEVGRLAREAITVAVRARDISEERALAAERRSEIQRRDEEVRRATNNASDLESKLTDTDTRLRASEIARANAEEQLARALREAADARAENRQLLAENSRLRREVEQSSTELTGARQRITSLESQFTSASSRIEEIEKRDREKAEAETRRRNFSELQTALAKVGTVKPTADGFVLVLSDSYFVAPNQTSLGKPVKAKMDALGSTLTAYPDIVFTIEGHSDARANAEAFALGRAQSVADYIAAYNVPRNNFRVESRGSSVPASSGKTLRARALNRRVEIVFISPDRLDRN
ncbi:MAG TPA: OmpA family protein [Blastocatellia bacterium]|nr:OmpA family protein [Blastocatellia bacterium]